MNKNKKQKKPTLLNIKNSTGIFRTRVTTIKACGREFDFNAAVQV
jgi:hypothetical protein